MMNCEEKNCMTTHECSSAMHGSNFTNQWVSYLMEPPSTASQRAVWTLPLTAGTVLAEYLRSTYLAVMYCSCKVTYKCKLHSSGQMIVPCLCYILQA